MKRGIILLLAVLALSSIAACGTTPKSAVSESVPVKNDSPQMKVMEPWSRSSSMTGGNGAVYMMLMNEGGNADKLASIESDVAERAELHETKIENDVMKMSPIQGGIEVPGGGSVELKPGGMHVMLINLKKELVPGQKLALTLNFEKSGPITVEAEIRDMGGEMGQDMDQNAEHKMEEGQ